MVDSVRPAGPAARRGEETLGHPRGLFVLFLTEMWERFSYYGMRALLIFYLTQHFLFSDQRANLIYGAYIALVYVMPVIGGMLADRYLGARKAVTFGAILLVAGHTLMAVEGEPAREIMTYDGQTYELVIEGRGSNAQRMLREDGLLLPVHTTQGYLRIDNSAAVGLPRQIDRSEVTLRTDRDSNVLQLFYLALALIITGVGFLKANISTIVGALYPPGDERRDAGFTIFYMGINLGAFSAAILCGFLGQVYGWAYGFGLAGIGMLAGLVIFLRGQHLLMGTAEPPDPKLLEDRPVFGLRRETLIYIGGIAMIAAAWFLVQSQELFKHVLNGFALLVLAGIVAFSLFRCPREDRDRMLVATALILFQIPFWALFEQAGSSLNLFADRAVDRTMFGFEIPASVFQSLNAMFIITLAPLFSMLWVGLARRGLEPSTPMKFVLGLLQVGLGFLVLVFGIQLSGESGLTPLIWLVLIYFLHTTGELCLSPVGLSMITKLSVKRVVGMMMGAWFLAIAFGSFLAGQIAALTGAETVGGEITDLAAAKSNYVDVYTNVGLVGIGVAALLLVLTPLLRKGMHGVR